MIKRTATNEKIEKITPDTSVDRVGRQVWTETHNPIMRPEKAGITTPDLIRHIGAFTFRPKVKNYEMYNV